MPGIRRFLLWARALMARGKVDDELTREMRFHLEMEVEKNIRAGMSPDEARRRALVTSAACSGSVRRSAMSAEGAG